VSQSGQILRTAVFSGTSFRGLTHGPRFFYIYLLLTGLAFYSPWCFGCHRPGRRADFSHAASVAGMIFFGAVIKCKHVGGADAHDGSGQGVVECDWALHAE